MRLAAADSVMNIDGFALRGLNLHRTYYRNFPGGRRHPVGMIALGLRDRQGTRTNRFAINEYFQARGIGLNTQLAYR